MMKDPSVVSTGACTTGPTKWDIYVSNQYIVATHRLSNVMEVPGREFYVWRKLTEIVPEVMTPGVVKSFAGKGSKTFEIRENSGRMLQVH